MVNTDDIVNALDEAIDDESTKAIILDINSCGGETTGIEELARKIKSVDTQIPVYCWCENSMYSAAYWLGSQARFVGMTPSAGVGSVGVYTLRFDISEKNKNEGVKVNAISSGKYKLMMHEFNPLTEEEMAIIQKDVIKTHDKFKNAILESRPNVVTESLEGLCYEGDEALTNNLVDFVTDDFNNFFEEISKQ